MAGSSAGLTSSLRSLVTALQTNQASLSYISDNIANVNTVGYARRIVALETQVSSGVGVGVNIAQIRRSIDEFLLKSVRAQLSKVGESTVNNTYFDRLQKFTFGDPNSKYTINNAMSEFYSRLENFSNNPSSAVNRTLVINSATDFTNGLNELSTAIQTERLNADTEISTTISDLNTILNNLADINSALRASAAVGGDKQSLEDARDFQINKLESIVAADLSFDSFGQVSASLSNTELLGFSQRYVIEYDRVTSVDSFINGTSIGEIRITSLDTAGEKTSNTDLLLSASSATTAVDNIPAGSLRALVDLRDTKLPAILTQLDTLAYTFANAFNEVHNSGTGFPPTRTMTGIESFALDDIRTLTGKTKISLVDSNGLPVTGRFGEKVTPLTIDFDTFNGEDGYGTASIQDIIDEINSYYSTQPTNIANVGPAKDIKLAAVSDSITSAKASGTVTFSGQPANDETLVINGTTITFKTTATLANEVQIGANTTATVENLVEALNLSSDANISEATYSSNGDVLTIEADNSGTTGNSIAFDASDITGATQSGATLSGGADASGNFVFDFDFSNLAENGGDITFDVTHISINGGATGAVTFNPFTQLAGERTRTERNGISNDSISTSLTGLGLEEGDTFTITATIYVTASDSTASTETVTYTVTIPDPDEDIKNTRYEATAIGSGDGELVAGSSTNGYITASLVNSGGSEITDTGTAGFLKLTTTSANYRIAIDQLDSADGGDATASDPSLTATDKGFSHLFGLNNFFNFGQELSGAAINIAVRDDIVVSPSLLSSGKVKQSVSIDGNAIYTYEIGAGSNESVLDLIATQQANLVFGGTGTLPELTTTASSYATEIYNYSATQATAAASENEKNNLLKSSLDTKVDDISGVNLDEELARTIEIQNAYSSAAKVLAIIRELFTKIENVLN